MKTKILYLIGLWLLLAACGGGKDDETPRPTQPPAPPAELRPQRPADLPTITVKTVLDGDTLELADGQIAQLIGISAPAPDDPQAAAALTFVRELLEGKTVGLEAGAEAMDAAGTPLFYLWIEDQLANFEIVRAGYANRAQGASTAQYDGFIAQAEAAAQAEKRGIWQPSPYTVRIDYLIADAPGDDESNLNGELVRIFNFGQEAVDLGGFTLRDSSNNTYSFKPGVVVLPSQKISVYSGCGYDTPLEIYWCASAPIWNNAGDSAFLRDPTGALVDRREIAAPN